MTGTVVEPYSPSIEPGGAFASHGIYPLHYTEGPLIVAIAIAASLLIIYSVPLVRVVIKRKATATLKHYCVFLFRFGVIVCSGTLVYALASGAGHEVTDLYLPVRLVLLLTACFFACRLLIDVSDYARILMGSKISSDVLDRQIRTDTFQSRVSGLVMMISVAGVFLVIVNQVLGMGALLTASGVVAILVLTLGYAQASWAPDYFNGLIILQTQALEPGDSVWLTDEDESFLAEILRIGVFHTDLIRYIDNQRMIIKNSQMRNYRIRNFSRLASARGRREALTFKIGYDVSPKCVRRMFKAAFDELKQDASVAYNADQDHSVCVKDTGDHAVEWVVYYYTREAQTLLSTRQKILEKILDKSIEQGISLGTPFTHSVELQRPVRSFQDAGPAAALPRSVSDILSTS